MVLTDQNDSIRWTLTKSGVYSLKSFMWLVLRNNILTKHNLARKGCTGHKENCPYCGKDESINHMSSQPPVSKLLWHIMKCAFNLDDIPDNVHDMFNHGLKFNKIDFFVMVGHSAILWTVWKLRNSIVFDNNKVTDPCTHVSLIVKWLHDWIFLQINP